MVDVNEIVCGLLSEIEGVSVSFYHPNDFSRLPCITYYELISERGFYADDIEYGQTSSVAIDIWAGSGKECGDIAIKTDDIMRRDGWVRKYSRDMPKDSSGKTEVYHKTMRYRKQIFY